ncbi:MAG: hypothetical protein GY913_20120 [Proteobacteria bacterium]|nr:hypothetical protein [Pseudomonadota bacterium]MCP4919213.1 hypothetical protein [Pseudomonadota bacterium]
MIRRAAPVCVAALVVLLVGWPAVGGDALGTRTLDGLGSWWFQWWAGHALLSGESLLHAAPIFHPYGKDVLGHTGANLVDALAAVPLRAVFGAVGGWNAVILGIVLANGVAASWVLRGKGLAIALTAGVVAALNPYSLYEIAEGRPTQALLAPLIVAISVGHRILTSEDRSVRDLGVATVALALSGYVYWFGGLFAGLALGALALTRPRRMGRIAAVGAAAVVLTLPVVAPLMLSVGQGTVPGTLPVDTWCSGLDLVTAEGDPMVLCTLERLADVGKLRADGWTAVGPAGGVVAWLLALAAGLRDRRLLVIPLVALALAVGPRPWDLPNPVYLAFAQLPGMDRLYWPCRALALLTPPMAIGAAELVERRTWAGPLLVVALIAESGARDRLPLDTWDPRPPAGLECVVDGGVVDLPHARDHEPLLLQTWHEQVLLSGMNPRSKGQVPSEIQALRSENTWLAALLAASSNPRDQRAWDPADREALGALGYRWVVLRLEPIQTDVPSAAPLHLRAMRGRLVELAGPPVAETEALWIFAPWGGSCP